MNDFETTSRRGSRQEAPIDVGIPQLNLDTLLPTQDRASWKEDGGGRYVVVGAPGTGKSWIIRALLFSKSHFIPVATCISENEDVNNNFKDHIPNLFIFTENSAKIARSILDRQRIACSQLAASNPLSTVIIDDCMNEKKVLRNPEQIRLFKISRQLKLFFILSCQYNMDLPKELRNSLTGAFICRESKSENLEVLYKTYGGPIPDMQTFKQLIQQITTDNCCLYVAFNVKTDNWRDAVFWFRAFDTRPENFGKWDAVCRDAKAYFTERYDVSYDPLAHLGQ